MSRRSRTSTNRSSLSEENAENLERDLHATQERLQTALDALETTHNEASVGAWECDVATGRILWSDRLQEMLGIVSSDPAAQGDDILTRMHPDNTEHWLAQFAAAVTANAPINIEIRLRRKYRNYVWLHMLGHVAGGTPDSPTRIVGTAQDISYRKNAELDRTFIKERFELALQSLSVGIWDWNLVDRQLYWSPNFKRMLGISDVDFRPRPIDLEKRMHAKDVDGVLDALRDHIEDGKPFDCECRLRHDEGHYIWTRLCGVAERNSAGKAIRMVGSVDDISIRKLAEQKLSEREARLRNMFEHAVDGLITIDGNGTIQSSNPACEKLFAFRPQELVGKNISLLMPEFNGDPRQHVLKQYLNAVQGKVSGMGRELEGRRKDGTLFSIELLVSQFEAGGEPLFSAVVRDITGRKQVERMKNEFISVVSHELRTPLTSIRGAIGLLTSGRESALPQRTMELLKIAQRNSELLMVLINDILDIEKLESGTMKLTLQPVELGKLLADSVRANSAYAARFEVTIKLRVEDDLPMVVADPDRLMQVVANLLSNAAKFTRPGTMVDVRAGKKGDRVRISVRDHGPGIPDEYKGILFDKFFQADPSNSRERAGTGLGLSIARHFTRLMNGEIDFTSQLGKGATFFVDLPITAAGIAAHALAQGNGARQLQRAIMAED